MTRLLLAAPWTALLIAGLLPWLNPSTTTNEETQTTALRDSNRPVTYVAPTEEETTDRGRRRALFLAYQEKRMADLVAERLTLRGYVDSVFSFCLVHYPEHLENIDVSEAGCNLSEKLGRNLASICYIPGVFDILPNYPDICARLQSELRDLLCEEEMNEGK